MTRPLVVLALAGGLLLLAAAGTPASPPRSPERVESLRKRMLTPEQYRQLRDEWAAYTNTHPDDPVGWAQLARAANYAGDSCAAVVRYAEHAYRVGTRNVAALATLGAWKWAAYCDGQPDDASQAIHLLERALELDPGLDDAHIRLWVMRLSKGQTAAANAELAWLLDHGHIPEPLVDFGYNLLVGLEPNAILLTNGDNDTVPLVALQAARGFRPDVTVVNLSLLELGWYRRMLRRARQAVPVPALSATPYTGSTEAVRGLIDQLAKTGWKRPLYAACTVNHEAHPIASRLSLEGIVYRVLPQAGGTHMETNPTRIARNLEHVYRMQSATSAGLDWEAWSSVRMLMLNYVAAEIQLAMARAKAGDLAAAGAAMDRAFTLGEYHRSEFLPQLVNQWSAWDPKSPELARWKRKLKM